MCPGSSRTGSPVAASQILATFEKLENVVENLELLLKRRPDLDTLLAEPVGQAHICTDEEVAVQRSPGVILER